MTAVPEKAAEVRTTIASTTLRVALVGNPNTGKTSLFNRLTGLRARTANYPGITVDVRSGLWRTDGGDIELFDLPGMYSLDALSPEEAAARKALTGPDKPDVVVIVVDSTNVQRNLFLASEVRELNLPTVVAMTMTDLAKEGGATVNADAMADELSCRVVRVSSRKGTGLEDLAAAINELREPTLNVLQNEFASCTAGCSGCAYAARHNWAEHTANQVVTGAAKERSITSADRVLTHPILGLSFFSALMIGVFYLIFSLAGVPMDLIDGVFGSFGNWIAERLPMQLPEWGWLIFAGGLSLAVFAGGFKLANIPWSRKSTTVAAGVSIAVALLPRDEFQSLLVDGVIAGIGGMLIFLPQICILFFCISLLEDSGYMARAAFVMERLMRFVGLPGKAFVPMLSAHACAIPGIMATRVIENWRDRLVTILVLPFLTCSARLPVYAMVTALLFPDAPGKAALAFVGAYMLGIAAALVSAWALKKTVLKGEAIPLVMELPAYRRPSLRNALLTVLDRGTIFVRQAGTVILLISVILWVMATYPSIPESALVADRPEEAQALEYSFAGRAGRLVEPIFEPLGFDWKINVGVMTSFAAREVVVSTLAVVYGLGEDAAENKDTLIETLRQQTRPDGSPVFDTATGLSLLVFFVLAMQCLPTQAVTRRETGSWKWAIVQLVYMTVLAWCASAVTYNAVRYFA